MADREGKGEKIGGYVKKRNRRESKKERYGF